MTPAAWDAIGESRVRVPRLDPSAVRRTLKEAGLRPRHALSQNFLADPDVLQAILDEARPPAGGRVLEIGPGLGILTGGLLAAGAAVTAVELDSGLAARLRSAQAAAIALAAADPDASGGLRLVEGDVLDQELDDLVRQPFDVVANLPYHITSPVLHLLLGQEPRPERLVLMLQREVAERIAARPGRMSYLSVFVQYHADVRVAFVVPREAFEPPPAVESAVVVIEPRAVGTGRARAGEGGDAVTALGDTAAEDDLWRLVQAGFRERRKMLRNVLARQLPVPAATVERALETAGIAADRRPQTLGVGEWIALREALGPVPGDQRGRRVRAAAETGESVEPAAAHDSSLADDPNRPG